MSRMLQGRSLLPMLLMMMMLTPRAGLALDLFDAGKLKALPEEKAEESLLDDKPLKLDVELPDFPAAREAAEKEGLEKVNRKAGLLRLPESIRKNFSDFAGKVWELRRAELRPALEEAVKEVKTKGKLNAEAAARLDALAESAMKDSERIWLEKFAEMRAPSFVDEDPVEVLKSWTPDQFAADTTVSLTPPDRTEVWKQGLKEIVTPEYHAAVEAEAKAAGEKALKEAEGVLLDAETRADEALAKLMDTELEPIFLYVTLDENREKALRKAAEEARKAILKNWRRRAEKQVTEMAGPSDKRPQQQPRDFEMNLSEKENRPQENELWRKARRDILTESERQSIEEGQKEIKQRRATALAMMILAEMDQQVGFSSAQRGQLLTLGSEHFLSLGPPFIGMENTGFSYLDPGSLLTELREIPASKLSAVLDAGQMTRWKAVSPADLSARNIFIRSSAISESKAKASDDSVDELEASRLTALKLADNSTKIKERYFSRMEGRIENLVRVIPLPAETITRLRTAGKGAAEQMAQNAIGDMEQNLLRQIRGVKPSELPDRLEKVYVTNYQERGTPVEAPVWAAALKRFLTKPQLETWKQEGAAARTWRFQALSALVASEVEKQVSLSPEKSALLRDKLEGVIREFETDISNMMSPGWQYQSYYSPIPVALLTEKEMAGIFTPKQLETVRGRCLANADQFATMIRRQHSQRQDR